MKCKHPEWFDSLDVGQRDIRWCVKCGYRVVCLTCNDTHKMEMNSSIVPCTRCPVPCHACRTKGVGAYCTKTPCQCNCHERRFYGYWNGMCSARKHGLDYEGQRCDLCEAEADVGAGVPSKSYTRDKAALAAKRDAAWKVWLAAWLAANGMNEKGLKLNWAGNGGENECKRAFHAWFDANKQ